MFALSVVCDRPNPEFTKCHKATLFFETITLLALGVIGCLGLSGILPLSIGLSSAFVGIGILPFLQTSVIFFQLGAN